MVYHVALSAIVVIYGGCTASRVCDVCNNWENITIQSKTRVELSKCGALSGPGKATISMEKGAHSVVIVGPGVIKGIQWPLRPGPGFSITSNVKLDTDGAASAIDITYAGDVTIEGVTTDALALARVYADSSRLRKLDFKKHKVFIHGTAKKVVAGFGHVASHKKHPMTVKCNNQSQWVVKQELHSDGGYFSTSGCTMVDLQALMNMYGDEYESRLFPPPPERWHVSWRLARIATACAGASFVVLVLGFQLDITRFWHALRKSHAE